MRYYPHVLCCLLLITPRATWLAAAQEPSHGEQRLGKIYEKHDGRRGTENPYSREINAAARGGLRSGSSSSVLRSARFALMATPVEPTPVPPVPPYPSPTDDTTRTPREDYTVSTETLLDRARQMGRPATHEQAVQLATLLDDVLAHDPLNAEAAKLREALRTDDPALDRKSKQDRWTPHDQ